MPPAGIAEELVGIAYLVGVLLPVPIAAGYVMERRSSVLDVAPLCRLLLQRPRPSDASGYRS